MQKRKKDIKDFERNNWKLHDMYCRVNVEKIAAVQQKCLKKEPES